MAAGSRLSDNEIRGFNWFVEGMTETSASRRSVPNRDKSRVVLGDISSKSERSQGFPGRRRERRRVVRRGAG